MSTTLPEPIRNTNQTSSSDESQRGPAALPIRSGLRAGVPLGDAVAWFTHTTHLDELAKKYTELTGKDCGCEQRREFLNRLLPF
jgi:hypothetical protein